MGFLKKLIKFEKSHFKNLVKGIKKDPKRLLLGVDPLSTKAWNKVLGQHDRPLVNQLGGATAYDYEQALKEGIDIGPGKLAHDIAGVVAGAYGAGALGNVGGLGKLGKVGLSAATMQGSAALEDEIAPAIIEMVENESGEYVPILRGRVFNPLDDPSNYGQEDSEYSFFGTGAGGLGAATGGFMRRQRLQAGGSSGVFPGMTGAYPRPGLTNLPNLTGYYDSQPALEGLDDDQLREQLLAYTQTPFPDKPTGFIPGMVWDAQQKLRKLAAERLGELDPTPGAPGDVTEEELMDRSNIGQVGGLEDIVQRYEGPRTSDVEPGTEWVTDPAQDYSTKTPSSLLQYLEHMRAKNTATFEGAEGMQYGGTPVNWRGAGPQQAQMGRGRQQRRQQRQMQRRQQQRGAPQQAMQQQMMQQRQQAMAQQGKQPQEQMVQAQPFPMQPQQQPMMQAQPFPAPQQPPMGGGQGIQAGPLPPGMGPGAGMPQQPQQQQMEQLRQTMQQQQGRAGGLGGVQGQMGGRQMMQQRAQQAQQAMGQPPGGGGGGGGGMLGGPRIPPNLQGRMQAMRMQNRPAPGPGGNRIGGGDQQGAMARARQSQTGRQPISRRSAFPGRPR